MLERYWLPYHNNIEKDIITLDKAGHKKILYVEFHNTS